MKETYPPALSAEEWDAYFNSRWSHPRSMAIVRMDEYDDYHGGAAIALHGQAYGFTHADCRFLRISAAAIRAAQMRRGGEYSDKLDDLCARIESLLPPE